MVEIEIAAIVSVISVLIGFGGLIFTVITLSHNRKKDLVSETTAQASESARIITKLDGISEDVKDVKAEYRNVRGEISKVKDDLSKEIKDLNSDFNQKMFDLAKDISKVETSTYSAHARLDMIGAPSTHGKEE